MIIFVTKKKEVGFFLYLQIFGQIDQLFPKLLDTLSDPSDEVCTVQPWSTDTLPLKLQLS